MSIGLVSYSLRLLAFLRLHWKLVAVIGIVAAYFLLPLLQSWVGFLWSSATQLLEDLSL